MENYIPSRSKKPCEHSNKICLLVLPYLISPRRDHTFLYCPDCGMVEWYFFNGLFYTSYSLDYMRNNMALIERAY